MKLISCNYCSIVLDHDKLPFAKDIWKEDNSIDETKAMYDQFTKEWTAYVNCPVCSNPIFKED